MRRAIVLGAFASLLLGVAQAQPADSPVPAPTLEDREAAFGEINQLYLNGQKARAADGLVDLVNNPVHAAFHGEAYARFASILEELALPYGALVAWSQALQIDPTGVGSEAHKAIALADKVGDAALLEPIFATNVGLDVDPATRSRMAYLAAREAHHRGNWGTSTAMLKMVQKTDPFYPEAKSLEGVGLAMQGKHASALIPLQTALAAGAQVARPTRFTATVFLNIARAYYAAGNFPRAIEYYARIDRSSPHWPEAQLERAWSHFRLEDMNGALSLLHTHASPYFDDFYFPEAELLRVYGLFLMCKFPDATGQIEAFQERYRPIHTELLQASSMAPAQFFDQMRRQVEDGRSDLPMSAVRPFVKEDRFRDSLTAIRFAEDEIARLRNVQSNPFSAVVSEWMNERRTHLIGAEGNRIKARVSKMERTLGQMLNDSEMSKLDMLQYETRLFERASVAGEMPDAKRRVSRAAKVKKGHQHWPWQGEYWADEVGYYRIASKPDCPAGMSAGKAQ